MAMRQEEEALASDLREVSIFNKFCYFDGKIFKATKGWATGAADGREMAEIVLAVKERPILLKYAANLIFIRRYVDDCGGWFRGTEQELRLFLQDYKDMSYFETTDEYSQES